MSEARAFFAIGRMFARVGGDGDWGDAKRG